MHFLFHQSFWYSIGMKGFCNQLFGKKSVFDHSTDCGAYEVSHYRLNFLGFHKIRDFFVIFKAQNYCHFMRPKMSSNYTTDVKILVICNFKLRRSQEWSYYTMYSVSSSRLKFLKFFGCLGDISYRTTPPGWILDWATAKKSKFSRQFDASEQFQQMVSLRFVAIQYCIEMIENFRQIKKRNYEICRARPKPRDMASAGPTGSRCLIVFRWYFSSSLAESLKGNYGYDSPTIGLS